VSSFDPPPVVLLAYTGDVESSVAISWLADQYHSDIATLTLDVGQGSDLSHVRERALALGAARAHVMDVRAEFARTAVAPAFALGVDAPRVASLARPLVAKYLALVAAIEGTTRVAHGSHLADSDPAGVNALLASSNPGLQVLAPCRDWGMQDEAVLSIARSRGIAAPMADVGVANCRTLWGRAVTGDLLARPSVQVPPSAFTLTRATGEWPNVPAMLDLEFAKGLPVSLNHIAMPLIELLPSLETIAGAHGLGRVDFAAVPGVRHRIIEEVPGPMVVHHAMKALSAVVPAMWPEVHGTVRMKCFKGECDIEEVSI
jgi:argininosuccinate synthase